MSELVKKITIAGESREIGVPFENIVDKPSWLSSSKPEYTALEVGALPNTTPIPTKTSELTNDSNFVTTDTIQFIDYSSEIYNDLF